MRFRYRIGRPSEDALNAMAPLLFLLQVIATATILVPVSVRADHSQAVVTHVTTIGNSVTVQFN
jgi:hypothetical protein